MCPKILVLKKLNKKIPKKKLQVMTDHINEFYTLQEKGSLGTTLSDRLLVKIGRNFGLATDGDQFLGSR